MYTFLNPNIFSQEPEDMLQLESNINALKLQLEKKEDEITAKVKK